MVSGAERAEAVLRQCSRWDRIQIAAEDRHVDAIKGYLGPWLGRRQPSQTGRSSSQTRSFCSQQT